MNTAQNRSTPSYSALHVGSLLNFALPQVKIREFRAQPKPLADFVTFYDPGWSILRLRAIATKRGAIFYPQSWYDTEPFASFKEPPRYRQLRMNVVPNSFGTTFVRQQVLLPADEEVPPARVVVMGMVIHFLATGELLFQDHVRCIDRGSGGGRVSVGGFDADGLRVGYCWDDDRDGAVLGLASSRKF